MRWNAWGLYFLLAGALTAAIYFVTPGLLPGELTLTRYIGLPRVPVIWEFQHFLNAVIVKEWLLGALVLGVLGIMYFLLPPRQSILPLAALTGGFAIYWCLDTLVVRTGPVGYECFPAKHALIYTSWLGGIALVAIRKMRSDLMRRIVVAVLCVLVIAGGLSSPGKIYWFGDILAGWLWGAAWICWLHQATKSSSA